jgi:hypothetical protein
VKTVRKHLIDARPIEAIESGVKHVWYYSFRSKKLNEGLEFWKSGMSRMWYELIKNVSKPKD